MRFLTGLPLALLAGPAFAQDVRVDPATPTEEGTAIIVTGRGLGPPPGAATDAVVSIERDRLTAIASGRVEDALRDVAGFAQFRRSDARTANPTSQGATLRGLGGNAAARVLVLIDGVPQADPFGGWLPFSTWQAERIGGIRVTRGGGSGFAGQGALAGTVEIDSVGAEADALSASLLGGSRGSVEAGAVARIDAGRGFLIAAGQYQAGNGFVPVDRGRGPVDRAAPYEQASGSLRFVAPFGDSELQATIGGFVDRRDRGTDFTSVRSEGADASLRIVGRGPTGWALTGWLQQRSFASGFASIGAGRATVSPVLDQQVPSTGWGLRGEIAPAIGARATLRLGADLRRVSGETREGFQFVGGAPTRRRIAGGAATTIGAFAEVAHRTGPLDLALAARIDHWRLGDARTVERVIADGVLLGDTRFAARDGWQPSGRVGVAWEASPGLSLRSAAYRGWRLPTLNELYRPFRAGADATAANAALDPETLSGAEIGIDWRAAPGLRFAGTAFVNRLDNAIANVTIARGPGTFPGVGFVGAAGEFRQRRNLDAVTSIGAEIEASVERGPFSASLSYSHADARVEASGAAATLDGLRPAQVAVDQLSARIGWSAQGWRLSATLRHVGPQFDDDSNQRRLAAATTVDLFGELPVSPRLSVVARAENLFDVYVPAAILGDGIVERGPPRTLWIGARLRID